MKLGFCTQHVLQFQCNTILNIADACCGVKDLSNAPDALATACGADAERQRQGHTLYALYRLLSSCRLNLYSIGHSDVLPT